MENAQKEGRVGETPLSWLGRRPALQGLQITDDWLSFDHCYGLKLMCLNEEYLKMLVSSDPPYY